MRVLAPSVAVASMMVLSCGSPVRVLSTSPVDDRPAPVPDSPPGPPTWTSCRPSEQRCIEGYHQTCVAAGELTRVESDRCAERELVCVATLGCVACVPGAMRCADDQLAVERCGDDGLRWTPERMCDLRAGEACRGARCVNLCAHDTVLRSNMGCEYFGVDLDNIVESQSRSAAAQQYAIVVSNPDPALTARVEVHRNNAAPGEPLRLERVASAVVPPRDLEVFPLPAREVDCSTAAGLNDGTGTCLSSRAYRVTSNVPIIAYQFNPLENVEVFSNDASLLIPTNSLDGQYRVLGWPQNFSNVANPDGGRSLELRAYMTIVGVRERTTVTITPTADVIPGGPLRERLPARTPFRVVLGPFDVLNLETGSFLADFTGSTIDADQAVAVFTGTECSDVPFWTTVSERRGNCDHLEQQLVPVSTTGNRYVASRFPRRTPPVAAAGAAVAQATEPDWFRVLNVSATPVRVDTTLPRDPAMPDGPTLSFDLAVGAHRDLVSTRDFTLRGSGRITLAQLMAGQTTTGIPFPLPGGDPSLLIVPSVEQWRADYVFLTPDKYAFDFVQIVARPSARVFLDETPVDGLSSCIRDRSDGCIDTPRRACPPPTYVTWRCQLSFPRIEVEHTSVRVLPGRQGDGVHTVRAVPEVEGAEAETAMVIVSGFDQRVSYAYAAGTNLTPIP